jgi:hypothetical protein
MTRPHIGTEERRARLGLRHRFAPGTQQGSVAEAAASMVALHATDAASVYLGPHRPRLFDTNGNAGPTIWVDGRVVGGWAQRRSGEIVPWLLEDVGSESLDLIDAEAARLEAWVGPARVSGSFPTPLEIELRTPQVR